MTIETLPDAQTRMGKLYEDHSRPLLNFLFRLTRGEQEMAEDLLQETMIRAWQNLDRMPLEPEQTRRWLFTVARRLAIDAARKRRARPTETNAIDLSRIPATDHSPDEVVAMDTLRQAMDRLSDAHRTILSELYIQGRSPLETAMLLGVPIGTVKSRAHYAMRTLRSALIGCPADANHHRRGTRP